METHRWTTNLWSIFAGWLFPSILLKYKWRPMSIQRQHQKRTSSHRKCPYLVLYTIFLAAPNAKDIHQRKRHLSRYNRWFYHLSRFLLRSIQSNRMTSFPPSKLQQYRCDCAKELFPIFPPTKLWSTYKKDLELWKRKHMRATVQLAIQM
jgi:hypothetical protein